jgi:hypothetical protein
MGPNPYFFQFVKQRKRDLPKVSYIEHVLPSLRSLNKKKVLIYLDGGEIERSKPRSFSKHYQVSLMVALEHDTSSLHTF